MNEGQPSRTALLTAVQRAHHYLNAPEPKVLRDDLAQGLTGLKTADDVQAYIDQMTQIFASLSDLETAKVFMSRIEGAVCMRSRVVEEHLAAARERGLQQLVVLGAGLDSTAYRCSELTEGLQVFEVDHPSTQLWKREQLEAAKIPTPDNLQFVAFDFENETLADSLAAGGVSQEKMTLFTWLGVQMYLTDEAVQGTLGILGGYPVGSELVMDFISPTYVTEGDIHEESVADLQAVVSNMGEPILSRYYEDELESILKTSGFTKVNYLNARWLVDNYLDGNKNAFDMPDKATSILTARI